MTQRRSAKQDRTALTHYLRNAGETGIRSYVMMLVGALQARAATTANHIDDVIALALQILVERLFPPEAPQSQEPNGQD